MAYFHSFKFFLTLGFGGIALISYIVLRARREYLKNDPEYQKRREEAEAEYRRKLMEQTDLAEQMDSPYMLEDPDAPDNEGEDGAYLIGGESEDGE